MTTDRPQKLTINATTGEQILEYLTDEEIQEWEISVARQEERRAQEEAEATIKAEAKASAIAKLSALGLSEEEVKAITD
jgi:DNA-binding transcriptional regulator YhcF (GntR family)